MWMLTIIICACIICGPGPVLFMCLIFSPVLLFTYLFGDALIDVLIRQPLKERREQREIDRIMKDYPRK